MVYMWNQIKWYEWTVDNVQALTITYRKFARPRQGNNAIGSVQCQVGFLMFLVKFPCLNTGIFFVCNGICRNENVEKIGIENCVIVLYVVVYLHSSKNVLQIAWFVWMLARRESLFGRRSQHTIIIEKDRFSCLFFHYFISLSFYSYKKTHWTSIWSEDAPCHVMMPLVACVCVHCIV